MTITILIILLTSLTTLVGWKSPAFLERLIFDRKKILDGEFYRMLSSALLHLDAGHLLFNMFSFYSFAISIEKGYGSLSLLLIYIASISGGSLVSLLQSRGDHRALGASGGVAGVLYSSVFLFRGGSIYIIPFPFPIPDWLFAIGYVAVTYYMMKKGNSRIGHDAHLGGAFTGILAAIILAPAILWTRPLLLAGMILPVLAITVYERMSRK